MSHNFFHYLGGCLPFAKEGLPNRWTSGKIKNGQKDQMSEMEIVEMERSEMESVEMERNVTRLTLDSADQS